MRVLVLGATGLLGGVLLKEWSTSEVTGIGSRDVDVCDRFELHGCFSLLRPECAALAAALRRRIALNGSHQPVPLMKARTA